MGFGDGRDPIGSSSLQVGKTGRRVHALVVHVAGQNGNRLIREGKGQAKARGTAARDLVGFQRRVCPVMSVCISGRKSGDSVGR